MVAADGLGSGVRAALEVRPALRRLDTLEPPQPFQSQHAMGAVLIRVAAPVPLISHSIRAHARMLTPPPDGSCSGRLALGSAAVCAACAGVGRDW